MGSSPAVMETPFCIPFQAPGPLSGLKPKPSRLAGLGTPPNLSCLAPDTHRARGAEKRSDRGGAGCQDPGAAVQGEDILGQWARVQGSTPPPPTTPTPHHPSPLTMWVCTPRIAHTKDQNTTPRLGRTRGRTRAGTPGRTHVHAVCHFGSREPLHERWMRGRSSSPHLRASSRCSCREPQSASRFTTLWSWTCAK